MSTGYINLDFAHDLRQVVRLDDEREEGHEPLVHAAILTTHDLNLQFVLTELLPGYLSDPTAVPPGIGPGTRTYRGPMLDLPPTAIVYAPEASVGCEVPWRPPAVDVCPYRDPVRRQHSKVGAILFSSRGARRLRLIASSANLTRRAFATNLEVAAFEDYEVGPKAPRFPSLYELRQLLEAIAKGSTLGQSRAYATIISELPDSPGMRKSQARHFVQSADPKTYAADIAAWLASADLADYQRAVVISPFFSAKGEALHRFFRDDLEFDGYRDHPIDVVVDGREVPAGTLPPDAPFATPPKWLRQYRGDGSSDYRPAILSRTRAERLPRGTGHPGRPLHAKVIAVAHERARAKKARSVWRILVGSSNFTEAGFGLAARPNLEAGFLVQHDEENPDDLFGPQPATRSLCVPYEIPPEEDDREGPDLGEVIAETGRAKSALRCLDEGGCTIERLGDGFCVRVDLTSAESQPDELRLGKETTFVPVDATRYEAESKTLRPYYLLLRFGDSRVSWPLPVEGCMEEVLTAEAGTHRRTDRLLEYWLRQAGQPQEADEEDFEDDPELQARVDGRSGEEDPLGSWRLNRLLLGARRRLTEALVGIPPRLPEAEGLLATVRVRELVALAAGLPPADRLYFGALLRAALLGYWAGQKSKRPTWATAKDAAEIHRQWRREPCWKAFEQAMKEARSDVRRPVLDALDGAAEVVFLSVRNGELPK